jgi:mRNA-degrading endonuclease YafQ of YafQ-DinJ toxin-antitoxin module
MYTLVWSPAFVRSPEKFVARHPGLRQKFGDVLRALEQDPFQPRLKYHHLGGKLKGVQAVSITDSSQITLTLVIVRREVLLLDVGSHDDVYG